MAEKGLIYAVICALAQGMDNIVTGVCLERLLTGRNDKVSRRKRLILWSALSILFPGIKCLSPLPDICLTWGNPILMTLWYILFMKYCYSDKAKIKFLHMSVLVLQTILSDVIHEVVFGRGVEGLEFSFAVRDMAEGCVFVAILAIILHVIYTMLMLKIQKKRQIRISPVWIANMLLLILVFVAIQFSVNTERFVNAYFVFICIFSILEFSMVMLYLSQSEKREAQEEKRAAQEEISKLQQVMELEKVHYEQIEARREEMAKIRHDYNNVITSVLFLMKNGETDEAEDVIMDLSQRIDETREYPFCAVPIINAILTEKQKTCEAEKIALTADLLIPERTGVADLDWCMIFGNLVDNAIRSCLEVRAQEKVCSITLNAGVVQEYLIVRCQNTSLENKEKKIKGSGYGHKILADIAAKYDGDFQTNCENGIFTAQISLKRA